MIKRHIYKNNFYTSKQIEIHSAQAITIHNNPETIAFGFHFNNGHIIINGKHTKALQNDLFITGKSTSISLTSTARNKAPINCYFIFFRKDKFIALTRKLNEKYRNENIYTEESDRDLFIYPNQYALYQKTVELSDLNKMPSSNIKTRLVELKTEEFILQSFQSNVSTFYTYLLTSTHLSDPISYTVRLISDAPEKNWSIKELAEKAGVSESTLYRYFKTNLDTTPNQFLWEIKINFAKKLLRENKEMNISEIAYHIGINNPMYFSRVFKSFVNMTPKNYRDNHISELVK